MEKEAQVSGGASRRLHEREEVRLHSTFSAPCCPVTLDRGRAWKMEAVLQSGEKGGRIADDFVKFT